MAESVLDHGAVGDGVTDDTVAIQNVLNTFQSVLLPEGRAFKIDCRTGLALQSGQILGMRGATVLIGQNLGIRAYGLRIKPGTTNVTIVGGHVIGSRTPVTGLQWGKGLEIDSAVQVGVHETIFQDWYFDGVWVGGNTPSRDVVLDHVTCDSSRRNAVTLTNADGVSLLGCALVGSHGQSPQAGLDVEPNPGESVSNLVLQDCLAEDNVGVGFYLQRGHGFRGHNYRVTSCSSNRNGTHGFIVNAVDGVLVANCEVDGSMPIGFSVGHQGPTGDVIPAENVTFAGNSVTDTVPRPLVLAGAKNIRVVGNRIRDSYEIVTEVSVTGEHLHGVFGNVVIMDNA